jgi:type III secretion protein J
MSQPLSCAIALVLAGCRAQIQHGLEERDANEIVSVLVARGFEVSKVPEKAKRPSWAIEVADDRANDALRVLTELKLPRPPRTTTRDVAQQSGLIDTPSAEKLRQLEALEGDIEQTLETMDGVVSAGVELVVPLAPRPGVTPSPSKASALLRVSPSSLERIGQLREQLKALIAGSVEGLRAEEVALVVDPAESHVATVVVDTSELTRLKVLVIVLASLLTLVAVILVATSLHLRRMLKRPKRPAAAGGAIPSAAPKPPPTPVQPQPRPVIAPAAQRRVA